MLRIERSGAIETWTLSDPPTRNALTLAFFEQLVDAVHSAGADPLLRAVVLVGGSEHFCSGGNLRAWSSFVTTADALELAARGANALAKLASLPVPTIAAISGIAFGGGAELMLATSMRVADLSARISFRHARLGVTTAWGTAARLRAVAGASRARRLLLTSCEVGAEEAFELGLLDGVARTGSALDTARGWAESIAKSPPAVARASMELLATPDASIDNEERRAFVESWTSEEHVHAVRSFLTRRPS